MKAVQERDDSTVLRGVCFRAEQGGCLLRRPRRLRFDASGGAMVVVTWAAQVGIDLLSTLLFTPSRSGPFARWMPAAAQVLNTHGDQGKSNER